MRDGPLNPTPTHSISQLKPTSQLNHKSTHPPTHSPTHSSQLRFPRIASFHFVRRSGQVAIGKAVRTDCGEWYWTAVLDVWYVHEESFFWMGVKRSGNGEGARLYRYWFHFFILCCTSTELVLYVLYVVWWYGGRYGTVLE